ncbi:branched-chain amino acid aminotransferase [Metabacillus fastidiosus]|uniref:branched-chain amino acid aminotransferase n=1 Tax=Metabacillus fastidiosus TaxID=1458 RepID=UPI002E248C41|nr:branched-chain amino acid aminotransferase [Metabacillus fastidiosus]
MFMLKDAVKDYITGKENFRLFKEEKELMASDELLSASIAAEEETGYSRFSDAYIERVHKETEELISEETAAVFLKQPIRFLKENKQEFIYLESEALDIIKADALTFEEDDVFKTYTVLLGLRQPKKKGNEIKEFLRQELKDESSAFQLMFNDKDGLWDVNFTLNNLKDFDENISFGEAYELIYRLLFRLVTAVEK